MPYHRLHIFHKMSVCANQVNTIAPGPKTHQNTTHTHRPRPLQYKSPAQYRIAQGYDFFVYSVLPVQNGGLFGSVSDSTIQPRRRLNQTKTHP